MLSADYHLARALMLSGKYEEALKLLEEVHRAWNQNPTANKDRLADLARTLAEIDLARGRLKEARERIDSSLQQFGYPSAQLRAQSGRRADDRRPDLFGSGQQAEAEAFATAALRISEGIARGPTQSVDVGEALLALRCAPGTGRSAAAKANAVGRSKRSRTPLERTIPHDAEAVALQTALKEPKSRGCDVGFHGRFPP